MVLSFKGVPCAKHWLACLMVAGGGLLLGGCLVQRTVTDESGRVIYQEPEVRPPFQSDEDRRREVLEKERELHW